VIKRLSTVQLKFCLFIIISIDDIYFSFLIECWIYFGVVIHVHTHVAYTPLHPHKILTFGNWTPQKYTQQLFLSLFSLFSFTLSSQTIRRRTHHPPPPSSTLLSLPSFSSPPFSLLHPFSPFPLTEHHHRPHLTSTGKTPKLITTASPLLFRRRWWKRQSLIHFFPDLGYLRPTHSIVAVVSVNFFTSAAPSSVLLSPHRHYPTNLPPPPPPPPSSSSPASCFLNCRIHRPHHRRSDSSPAQPVVKIERGSRESRENGRLQREKGTLCCRGERVKGLKERKKKKKGHQITKIPSQ